MNSTANVVQRTLLLSSGVAAARCQEQLAQLLQEWGGPVDAIGAVALETLSTAAKERLLAVVADISPPDLGQRLAQAGYQLAAEPRLMIIMVTERTSEAMDTASKMVRQVAGWIYAFLGIEAGSLLLLLEEEGVGYSANGRLPTSFSAGCCLLSRVNERGLCLSDETYTAVIGELLYCFVATPLLFELEAIMAEGVQLVETGFSLGFYRWSWLPRQTAALLSIQWQRQIIRQWLTAPPDERSLAFGVRQWLDEANLQPQSLVDFPLPEQQKPPFVVPWPWELRDCLKAGQQKKEQRHALLGAMEAKVNQGLIDTLHAAKVKVEQRIENLLDEQPVGGVAHAKQWLRACIEIGNEWLEQLEGQAFTQTQRYVELHGEQTRLGQQIDHLLTRWPQPKWRQWLLAALRVWRWPRLVWDYLKLRQQLFLQHLQADQLGQLELEKLKNHVEKQAVAEWVMLLKRIVAKVEEIGQMLEYLLRREETNGSVVARDHALHVRWIDAQEAVYQQLIASEGEEAVRVAAELGGLGQQLNALDDVPLQQQLVAMAQARFASVETMPLSAVWSLVPTFWEQGVEQTACLWNLDEAQLQEEERTEAGSHYLLLGKEVIAFTGQEELERLNARWIENADNRHVWLFRLRQGIGLPQANMEEFSDGQI